MVPNLEKTTALLEITSSDNIRQLQRYTCSRSMIAGWGVLIITRECILWTTNPGENTASANPSEHDLFQTRHREFDSSGDAMKSTVSSILYISKLPLEPWSLHTKQTTVGCDWNLPSWKINFL